MKNGKKIFILVETFLGLMVFVLVMFMFLEKNEKKQEKISVIIQNSDDSQWAAFKYGAKMAAADKKTEVFVVSTAGSLSVQEEENLIEREIANGASGIIVEPANGEKTEKMLKEVEKKVPVVLVESLASSDGTETKMPVTGADNYAMGKALAEELLKDCGGNIKGKKIGLVSGEENAEAISERAEGVRAVLEEKQADILWQISDSFAEDKEKNAVSLQEIRVAEENTAYASVDGVLFTKDLKEILCYPAARTDESFTLPKETEKYDEKETFVCEKLKDIHVEEGNSKYSSYDGCIYNKEKTLLLTIPEAKTEVKVPGTVVLDNTTFDSRSNITKIELEEGITTVMPYVFNYCTGIKELYLPDSLESIEADAFNGVNLKQVTVYGNRGTYAEEFAKKNGCTFVADTSDYKKGDVDLDGNVAIGDVRVVLRSICQKIELNEMQELAADVEKDDKVDIKDLRKILRYVCGKIDSL